MRVVVTPTQGESQAVLKSLSGALTQPGWNVPAWRVGDLLIIEPGMGPELTKAVLPCLESLKPREIWLFGCCGGLTPGLSTGDMVLAEATIVSGEGGGPREEISHSPDESVLAQARRIAKRLDVRLMVGPVLTSDRVLASVEQKRAGAETGALAVEMEAGPLARWAVENGVPFAHLRVVLDPLNSSSPATPLPIDQRGRVSPLDVLVRLLGHPGEWAALWRLMRQAGKTKRVMAQVIAALSEPDGPLAP